MGQVRPRGCRRSPHSLAVGDGCTRSAVVRVGSSRQPDSRRNTRRGVRSRKDTAPWLLSRTTTTEVGEEDTQHIVDGRDDDSRHKRPVVVMARQPVRAVWPGPSQLDPVRSQPCCVAGPRSCPFSYRPPRCRVPSQEGRGVGTGALPASLIAPPESHRAGPVLRATLSVAPLLTDTHGSVHA